MPKPMKTDARGMVVFHVASGFGGNTRQPFVTVEVSGQAVQMSPEAARALALNLLQCAEAAESDAGVVAWLESMDFTPEQVAGVLTQIRTARERRRGKDASTA